MSIQCREPKCACNASRKKNAAILEKRSSDRLGLLNTYTSIFDLGDENLARIKMPDDLFSYHDLKDVSVASRLLLPLSSANFVEETGEMKVLQGVRKFTSPEAIEVEGLEPIIDSEAFSIMA